MAVTTASLRRLAPRSKRAFSTASPPSVYDHHGIKFKSKGYYEADQPTVTVFGATGFIGAHVVSSLAKQGCQVLAAYRGDGRDARPLKVFGDLGQVFPIPVDVVKPETIVKAVERSQLVVNLLGRSYETSNYNFDDVHVKIAHRLAKTCKQVGVNRFFQISSVAADERSPSAWVASKARGEQAVKDFYPDATIFRLPHVFGFEDEFLSRYSSLLANLGLVPLVNHGTQRLQPTYAGDVARAITNAAITPLSIGKTYELGGPEILELREVLQWMSERLYQDNISVNLPAPVFRAIATLNQILPFNYRPWGFSADSIEQMKLNFVASKGSLGYSSLGVRPVSLKEAGAQSLIPQMRNRGPVRADLNLSLSIEDSRDLGDVDAHDRTKQYR